MNIFFDIPLQLSKTKSNKERKELLINYTKNISKQINRQVKKQKTYSEELYGDQNILLLSKEEETILICAHYDAFVLDDDTTVPGANDNGSGVAILLKLSESLKDKPVDFALFGSEEIGYLGSDEYINHLDKKHKFVINLDSCGCHNGKGILIPKMVEEIQMDITLNNRLIELCQKAIDLKPTYLDAYVQTAFAFEKKKDLEQALLRLDSAIEEVKGLKFQPNTQMAGAIAEIFFQKGRILYLLERNKEAIMFLSESLAAMPNHSNARYILGLVYEKQNSYKEALAQYELIKKSGVQNDALESKISEVKRKLGSGDEKTEIEKELEQQQDKEDDELDENE